MWRWLMQGLRGTIGVAIALLPAGDFAQAETVDSRYEAEILALINQRPDIPIATSDTTALLSPELPDLWWTHQQYGSKLVTDWKIFADETTQLKLVQLRVRSGIWSRYSYSERYAVVNSFGTEVRNAGYQMIVLDRSQNAVAAYFCQFSNAEQPQETACRLWLSSRYPQNTF